MALKCLYDEPLFQTTTSSTRWYQIQEQKDLFYITRSPIGIEAFRETNGDTDNPQTAFINLVEDGSDDLIPATFIPDIGKEGVPTVVEFNLFYY